MHVRGAMTQTLPYPTTNSKVEVGMLKSATFRRGYSAKLLSMTLEAVSVIFGSISQMVLIHKSCGSATSQAGYVHWPNGGSDCHTNEHHTPLAQHQPRGRCLTILVLLPLLFVLDLERCASFGSVFGWHVCFLLYKVLQKVRTPFIILCYRFIDL